MAAGVWSAGFCNSSFQNSHLHTTGGGEGGIYNYIDIYIYIYACVYMHRYMCIYIYIYTNIHVL